MEEKEKFGATINIYGGSQQILPNATEAVQNFYGDRFAKDILREDALGRLNLSPEARHLSVYINNVEDLSSYLVRLSECATATELALVVVDMVESQPRITKEEMVKERFIKLLLPLVPGITTGRSIDNVRARINEAWARRPKNRT